MKKRYRGLSGNSGVTHYEAGAGWIRVWFANGEEYRYSAARIGQRHIDTMLQLAAEGRGLSGYISEHRDVHGGYDR